MRENGEEIAFVEGHQTIKPNVERPYTAGEKSIIIGEYFLVIKELISMNLCSKALLKISRDVKDFNLSNHFKNSSLIFCAVVPHCGKTN